MNPTKDKPSVILIAEDDVDDQEWLMESAVDQNKAYCVEMLSDASALLTRLYDTAQPAPCLVVLDLNMPGLTGFEALIAIRDQHPKEQLPVVIFSTSDNLDDKNRSFRLGANDYIVKPFGHSAFINAARQAFAYCQC